MRGWRTSVAAAVLTVAIAAPAGARAASLWEDAGWGVLTVLSNVGYMPAKVLYATTGAITGGFAWVVTGGDLEIAEQIWTPALGGDFVLTPPQLRGEEPIVFAAFEDPHRDPDAPYRYEQPRSQGPDRSTLREEKLSGL